MTERGIRLNVRATCTAFFQFDHKVERLLGCTKQRNETVTKIPAAVIHARASHSICNQVAQLILDLDSVTYCVRNFLPQQMTEVPSHA